MIDLEINTDDLDDIIIRQGATRTMIKRAMRSTVGRMSTWMRTRVVKSLGSSLDITQKVLRRRLKKYRVKTEGGRVFVRVFAGLDPVGLSSLRPKQRRYGVKARGHKVKGAFLVDVSGGRTEVFKRKGKARYPLIRQELDINEEGQAEIRKVVRSKAFNVQFNKEFERQLAWRMSRQR